MDDQKVGWNFNPEDEDSSQDFDQSVYDLPEQSEVVSWTGSEYINNQKNSMWYLSLGGAIVLISGIIYFLSRDFISVGFIVIVGGLFAFMASRKPRQLQFTVDPQGIQVGQRYYPFSDYISFSLQRDGAISYISMLPLHRFKNELAIYCPPDQEEIIFQAISAQLPNSQRKETAVDKLARMIRF